MSGLGISGRAIRLMMSLILARLGGGARGWWCCIFLYCGGCVVMLGENIETRMVEYWDRWIWYEMHKQGRTHYLNATKWITLVLLLATVDLNPSRP